MKTKETLVIYSKVANKLNGKFMILFCRTSLWLYRDPQAISNKLLGLS